MNLNKLLPLTETTFYVMLALRRPAHGYAVMQTVETLSDSKVRIAAGTLYGALENLQKQKLIREVPGDDARRKVYKLTDEGEAVLSMEAERLRHMVRIEREFAGE